MNLNEYFGFPEGTKAQMRYVNLYDMVDSNFPCQKDMSNAFLNEGNERKILKKINITNATTNMTNMFKLNTFNDNFKYIEGIEDWDVSNVTKMGSLFEYCQGLTELNISNWNVSKVTDMNYMLSDTNIVNLDTSNWDTSKVTNMNGMFTYCRNLVTLGSIRCDSVTFSNYAGMFSSNDKLINFGGLINLKSQLISRALNNCPNLSYESCINVLNGLYDFVGNSVTPTSSQAKLLVHQNFLDKVGDEISIGTAKGWNIYA